MPISPPSLPPLSAAALKAVTTPLDRIRASYMDEATEDSLTPFEMKIRRELEATWQLLLNFHTPEQAVPVLVGQFDISRATAYRRCRDAVKLFGEVSGVTKQGISNILFEWQVAVYKLALSAKDKDGKPKPDLKAANQALKQMMVLKGLNRVEANVVDPSLLKGGTFLMQINVAGGKTETIDLQRVSRMKGDEYEKVRQIVEGTGIGDDQMLDFIDEAARGWQESTEDTTYEQADGDA